MVEHVKLKWIRALRDPGYKQNKTREFVDNYDRFDALGVLCNISPRSLGTWSRRSLGLGQTIWTFEGYYGIPPRIVLDWAGLSYEQAKEIATLNDVGMTFDEIADYIKVEL